MFLTLEWKSDIQQSNYSYVKKCPNLPKMQKNSLPKMQFAHAQQQYLDNPSALVYSFQESFCIEDTSNPQLKIPARLGFSLLVF